MKKFVLTLAIFLLLPLSAFAKEITVAAAANLQYTLEDLKIAFETETGIQVRTITGSSGKLTTQIENGAPFDIFMSADTQYPETLAKEKLTHGASRIYAYGTLVLWTVKDIDLSKGMEILIDPAVKKVAIASPKTAPYGRQSVNAIKHYNLYKKVYGKLVYGENISQASQFIATGAADVGFTAKSMVLAPSTKDKGKWVEVDSNAYQPIAQAVVILKYAESKNLENAQKFYDFIFSDKAKEIFKKYGYLLP